MTDKRTYILCLFINVALLIILTLISYRTFTLLYVINTLFFITIFYVLVYLCLFVTYRKFFDGITFGMRRFKRMMFERDNDLYRDEATLPSEMVNMKFYQMVKYQALTLTLVLHILLLLFYLL